MHGLIFGSTSGDWGNKMSERRNVILSVAAALGALWSASPAIDANAAIPPDTSKGQPAEAGCSLQPNTLVSTGEDLIGFIITEREDGTIIAQHVSHASHHSHASHRSHYSSR